MLKIRLETRDGGYVADSMIPPFKSLPEGLELGGRFFALHDAGSGHSVPVYREGMLWRVVAVSGEQAVNAMDAARELALLQTEPAIITDLNMPDVRPGRACGDAD